MQHDTARIEDRTAGAGAGPELEHTDSGVDGVGVSALLGGAAVGGLGADFNDHGPVYRLGADGYLKHQGRSFDDAVQVLSREWHFARGAATTPRQATGAAKPIRQAVERDVTCAVAARRRCGPHPA